MKLRSRRTFLKSGLVAAGGGALAACAPAAAPTSAPAGNTQAPAQVGSTGSTVEVTYWGAFTGELGAAEQAMVDRFNESQQDVRINYTSQNSYAEVAQKLTAAIQSNTQPDIALLSDVWWFRFYSANQLAPMDERMAGAGVTGQELANDFLQVFMIEGQRQGLNWWIPFARSTPIFYYNKDHWREAGLEDRAPETWAEYMEWAPSLVQRDGDTVTRAAFVHPNGASFIAWLFQCVAWQHGGQYSNDDFSMTMTNENTVRAGQFYGDTVNDLGWAILSDDAGRDFNTGLASAGMLSTAALASITANAEFEVGTGFLPRERQFGCCTGGAGFGILNSVPAERQQAAARFIAFATSTEQATLWSQSTGYIPVRQSAIDSESMQQFFADNPNFQTAVRQAPETRPQDVARRLVPGGDELIGKALERIMLQQQTPLESFEQANGELTTEAAKVLEALASVEG
jgi:sn-glycerol 3-phosphate transport system substrate-binding protein